jgi:type I restriction enzyme, S subunit
MEKLQGVKPNIRFPEFTDYWEHKKLSDLLTEAKKRNEDLKYDKDEVLSVSGELGIVNQIEHLGRSYAGVSVHQYHVVEVGDIVYTKSPLKANPYGIIKLNKHKAGIVSTLYAVYKVKEQNACGEWIEYYFSLDANTNRYLRPLVKKGAKNDMKISNAYVLNDRIFVPKVAEQKRIASFFTVVDKKIAQLKTKKQLLQQYKKGVMQQLFSQTLRFKDENGKEFPKWEVNQIQEVALISRGKSKHRPRDASFLYGGVYPFIQTGDIRNAGLYLNKYSQTYSEQGLKQSKLWDENTLCMTIAANIAETSILKIKACFPDSIIGIIPKENKTTVLFLKYQFDEFKSEFQKLSQGNAQENLNTEKISKIKFNFPSFEEQSKIVAFIYAIDMKLERTDNQIQQTQAYKKGLLQNMFI